VEIDPLTRTSRVEYSLLDDAFPSATISPMKSCYYLVTLLIACMLAGVIAIASPATAQTGSLEFVARATPSGGLDEPIRGFPFYLLTKSFDDISKEVDAAIPKPDMDTFIDKLEVSPELKQWMKKNHWTQLSGEDFIHKLHVDDIMNVPEFNKAYMERNSGDQSLTFPKPQVKPMEKTKDPAKFDKLTKEYTEAVRHFIEQNPQTIDGIDLGLSSIDPSAKWNTLEKQRVPQIHRHALDLAQSKYLVLRVATDLQGEGFASGLPAGTYWLSTLDVAADVGDARPRWDIPVDIKSGETARITLTDANAVQSQHSTP
jgi:hypothetical protein